MKIKELNKGNEEFKLIELKLSIESKRELEFFWVIFNAAPVEMADFLNDIGKTSHSIEDFSATEISQKINKDQIWRFFEEQMKRL